MTGCRRSRWVIGVFATGLAAAGLMGCTSAPLKEPAGQLRTEVSGEPGGCPSLAEVEVVRQLAAAGARPGAGIDPAEAQRQLRAASQDPLLRQILECLAGQPTASSPAPTVPARNPGEVRP